VAQEPPREDRRNAHRRGRAGACRQRSGPVWRAPGLAHLAYPALHLHSRAFLVGRRRGSDDDLFSYYGEHIRETVEAAQKLVAGTLADVTIDDFVERGILGPASGWLQRGASEEVRMTVIAPLEGDDSEFGLVWEHGHSLEARENLFYR
jgi:hypothetical protein